MRTHLEVEQSQGDVLDQFLSNILGVELGSELELQGRLFLHILKYFSRNKKHLFVCLIMFT